MASNKALRHVIEVLLSLDYKPTHATLDEVASAWRSAFSDLTDDQLITAVDRFVLGDVRGYWPKPGELRQLLIEPVRTKPLHNCDNCMDRGYTTHLMRMVDPGDMNGTDFISVHRHGGFESLETFTVACGVCEVTAPAHAQQWEDLKARGYMAVYERGHAKPVDVTPK